MIYLRIHLVVLIICFNSISKEFLHGIPISVGECLQKFIFSQRNLIWLFLRVGVKTVTDWNVFVKLEILLARKGLLIPKKLSVFPKQAWLFLVSVRLRFTSRIWLFHRHMLLIGDLFVFVFYHLSNSEHFNCCWYWFCSVFLCVDFQSRIWLYILNADVYIIVWYSHFTLQL